MSLIDYLKANAARVDHGTGDIEVGYFDVKKGEGASVEGLKAAIAEHPEDFPDMSDGRDHPFGELCHYLDPEGVKGDDPVTADVKENALLLMGLGAILGMWHVNTPKSVFGEDLPSVLESVMLLNAMVTISEKPRKMDGLEVRVFKIPMGGKSALESNPGYVGESSHAVH